MILARGAFTLPVSYLLLFKSDLNSQLSNEDFNLMNRKMVFCAYLLRNTRLSNREIAQKIGVDVSYFARTFKTKYHLSPGAFRKSATIAEPMAELMRYQFKDIKQEFHADMKAW